MTAVGAPEGAGLRIDVLTIFPEYLAPLELSLIGRARREGLLQITITDLRDFTRDRHRTVDDTPYGGGAGMVMRPEPWGEAIDAVAGTGSPHLIIPSPAGERFTQSTAVRLADQPWLVFACGRYEGIDERVVQHYRTRLPVSVLSLGDYVLGGGEVAALAMIEAVTRLVPGVLGNAASLAEESHSGGLLEYPVYTKPPSWRGLDVPEVLLSGDHGAIADWRQAQRRVRTATRRPDLLAPVPVALSAGPDGTAPAVTLASAVPADAAELMVLQWCCAAEQEQAASSRQLRQTQDEVRAELEHGHTVVARLSGRLIGTARARLDGSTWRIDRLLVAPDARGQGLGSGLLAELERRAPEQASRLELTGAELTPSVRRWLRRSGYRIGAGPTGTSPVKPLGGSVHGDRVDPSTVTADFGPPRGLWHTD